MLPRENTHETRSKYLTNDSITEKMKFYSHEAVEVSRLKCHPNGYGYGILFNVVEPLARGGGGYNTRRPPNPNGGLYTPVTGAHNLLG